MDAGVRRPAFGNPASEALSPGAAGDPLATLRNGARPATRLPDSDPHAAQREAFLAAERARTAASSARRDEDDHYSRMARRETSPTAGYVMGDPRQRSLLLAYVFWWFCAPIGLHRIYCGHKESAIYQVALFFGGFVILAIWPPLGIAAFCAWALWILADMFLIPGMMRRFKAAHEEDLAERFA
jgi:hypothetical protein